MEVDDSACEAALVQQLEIGPYAVRQGALATTDEDGAEEEVAFVHEAEAHRLARDLGATDAQIAP